MAANIDIALRMKDQATRPIAAALSDIQRRAQAVSTALSGLGGFLGVAGGGAAVITFFRGVVSETLEAERNTRKLENVLRSTGGAAGQTSKDLLSLANAIEETTGVEADLVVNAEAVLATFTRVSGQVFPEALKAAVDLSAFLGKDLQDTVTMVGKALNDPIKGLTSLQKVGVSFSADQKRQIKQWVEMGDIVSAQKVIMEELTTEYGNAAAAMQGPLSKALTGITADWKNFLQAVGEQSGKSGGFGFLDMTRTKLRDIEDSFLRLVNLAGVFAQMTAHPIRYLRGEFSGEAATERDFDLSKQAGMRSTGNKPPPVLGPTDEQIKEAERKAKRWKDFVEDADLSWAAAMQVNESGGSEADQAIKARADLEKQWALDAWTNAEGYALAWDQAMAQNAAGMDEASLAIAARARLEQQFALDAAANAQDYALAWDQAMAQYEAGMSEAGQAMEARARLEQQFALDAAANAQDYALAWDQAMAQNTEGLDEASRAMEARARLEADQSRWGTEAWQRDHQVRLEAADAFYEAMTLRTELWAEQHAVTMKTVADTLTSVFDSAVQGFSSAVATAIVYGKSLGDVLANVFKQLAVQILSFFIQLGIQALLSSLVQKTAELSKMVVANAANVSIAATAGAAWGASLGGPIGAAASGAASAAAAIGAGTAGFTAAMAAFEGLAAGALAGAAHGGLNFVPREQTMLLDRGERVLSPAQNRDLTDFIDKGGKARGGSPTTVILTLDGREVGRGLVDLVRGGRLPLVLA